MKKIKSFKKFIADEAEVGEGVLTAITSSVNRLRSKIRPKPSTPKRVSAGGIRG